MKKTVGAIGVMLALVAQGDVGFDAGADLRIRQEIMDNVPGLPGVGLLNPGARGKYTNHMRFRPRVWGEVKLNTENSGKFRIYTRLTDEFRWYVKPHKRAYTFPDELILDNLFVEGTGLFDEFLDFNFGRQDIYGLYGLDHVFIDGTPGDGSRTVYADVARACLHFTEASKLDLFALYDFDDSDVRWGTKRGKHRSLSGFGGGAEPEMDDWGFGAVFSSDLGKALPYQVFVMQKDTAAFRRQGAKHPRTQRNLVGAKLVPQLDEEWSLQFEGMGQVGENGDGDTLYGWSTYAGVNWTSATASSYKPYGKLGYHVMSGDKDAGTEDGGHSAWDPMWARGVCDSEGFLYGTHYGAGWWSNMHYVKLTAGLELGSKAHRVEANCGPMFAAARDGMGGDDGGFKGFLSQARYVFPFWLADKSKGERFEALGHVIGEWFNPGDYFATDKPSWFVRWQIELRF